MRVRLGGGGGRDSSEMELEEVESEATWWGERRGWGWCGRASDGDEGRGWRVRVKVWVFGVQREGVPRKAMRAGVTKPEAAMRLPCTIGSVMYLGE